MIRTEQPIGDQGIGAPLLAECRSGSVTRDERQARRPVEEDNVAGRMPRTVPNLEPFATHADLIALTQPAVRHKAAAIRKAVPLRLLWQDRYGREIN